MAPSLSWWRYCRYIRRCRKVPPCRRIGVVARLECGDTRRPSRHLARWQRGQEMILAKSGSTYCASVRPLRWRPGGTCQRVIQREGRWKSSESSKVYTRNNPEDAGVVSRKLAETAKIGQKAAWPRYCMEPNTVVSTRPWSWGLSMVCYHWGSRSPETACVSAPTSRLGVEFPDSGSTIGDEKQRPVPRLLYHASGAPPPTSQRIITT